MWPPCMKSLFSVSLLRVLYDGYLRVDLQLGRTILLIVWELLLSDSAQVPEDHSAIVATTTENGLFEGVPGQRCNCVLVAFEGVKPVGQVPQIPETNGLVG